MITPILSVFITLLFIAVPPGGSVTLCADYEWACSDSGPYTDNNLKLAKAVSKSVNSIVPQLSDMELYGVEEKWTMPSKRGGDCEDLVLLKKAVLIKKGVSPNSLLIATALDKEGGGHAVLVMRTDKGDYVLDNLTDKVVTWDKTGYTFLKIQDPKDMKRWRAVLAGGMIK